MTQNIYDVKQFKLTSGDEIVCDVVDWPGSDSTDIVVRNAMQIIKITESVQQQYYIFRPWIHYIESSDELIIVNSAHVVSTTNPNKLLFEQYLWAVSDMHQTSTERVIDWHAEQRDYISKVAEKLAELKRNDSDASNIIKFPVH